MRRPRPVAALLAAAFGAVLSCSLAVESSDLDSGCPEGQKFCPDHGCVPRNLPKYGCGASDCLPCRDIPNAVLTCRDQACDKLACLEGFVDCNDCADLDLDESNCGSCFQACDANAYCFMGTCTVHSEPPPPPETMGASGAMGFAPSRW